MALIAGALGSMAAAPEAAGYVDKLADPAERGRVLAELVSGDAHRVSIAMDEVKACALAPGHPNAWDLELLDRAGRPDEVEPLAIQGMLATTTDTEAMGEFELARVRAFTAANELDKAESAAKGYYNLVRLKDTSKAIAVVSLALIAAHPGDPGIASRFKAQQLAGTEKRVGNQPATQPDLGEPVLATIHVDGSPFEQSIKEGKGTDYPDLVAKGNLLLAADRPKEARAVFEANISLAGPPQLPIAVENVARAIRAESGAIAPANAYLASLSKK